MIYPPTLMQLSVPRQNRRGRLRLVLPVIVVWPVLVVLLVVAQPILMAVAAAFWRKAWARPVAFALPVAAYVFCCLRGLHVDGESDSGERVLISFN